MFCRKQVRNLNGCVRRSAWPAGETVIDCPARNDLSEVCWNPLDRANLDSAAPRSIHDQGIAIRVFSRNSQPFRCTTGFRGAEHGRLPGESVICMESAPAGLYSGAQHHRRNCEVRAMFTGCARGTPADPESDPGSVCRADPQAWVTAATVDAFRCRPCRSR